MNEITQPLRLAVGSHKAGSGRGCAMQVVSWQNGDTTITDLPDCADEMLARVVQRVNDDVCMHRDGDLLCPTCSMRVLALAHRTPGTRLPVEQAGRVQVLTACVLAEEVLHLVPESHRKAAQAAIDTARRWVAGEATAEECASAGGAASYPADYPAAAYFAFHCAVSAAHVVYDAYGAYGAAYYASSSAARLATRAAAATNADPVAHAHHVIDVWHQQREALGYDLPGWEPTRTVEQAIAEMQQVTS